eukprot:Phypoly_transcript_08416.p1 GENE.Phypoly_transcript_08416~~Phypoly_transcript_08416.p1  ORF type:complete len:424 (+),score=82.50 Phypoly_transcript_08416:245-1516(+)
MMDAELQNELMKNGEIQREKIDDDVEKFLEAAQKGDVAKVTEILKQKEGNKNFINEVDANKRTALHFAVHGDKLEVMKVLLANGADINAQDWEGYTPLMYGLKTEKENASLFLIENGADVNTITPKGITPLSTAVIGKNLKLINTLISKGVKAMPNKESESGSVLHHAVMDADTKIAEALLAYEPELVNSVDANGMIPLHFACATNNTKMALLLIDKKSDVNHASSDGTTPLHIAADAGNIAIVKSLIEHGAVQKMDSAGYTPIMSASKADSNVTKVLEDLLKDVKIDHTATVNKKQVSAAAGGHKLSAETLKDNGNKAFSSKDYHMALHWYNLALDVDSIYCEMENKPSSLGHILFSNRSATHYHLKQYNEALTDAESAINLAPSWPKGYLRKGATLEAMGKTEEAKACYEKQAELENKAKQ